MGIRVTIDAVLGSIDAGIDLARIRASYPVAGDENIATARAYRATQRRGRAVRFIDRHPDLVLVTQCVARKAQ